MKKLLLSMCVAALASSVAIAGTPQRVQRLEPSSFKAVKAHTVATKAPMKAAGESSLDFTYAAGTPAGALCFNNVSTGSVIYEAFEFTADKCAEYDGATVSSINIFSGINERTQKNNITDIEVFLASDLDQKPFYTQSATLGTQPYTENKIALTEPYTIKAGEPFVVGFSFKIKDNYDYYLCVDNVPTEDTYGGWCGPYTLKGIDWQNVAPGYGNLCMGMTISGKEFAKNAVSVTGISLPTVIVPNSPFNFSVQFKNEGANVVNSIEYEYSIDGGAAKTGTISTDGLAYNYAAATNITNAVCDVEGANKVMTVKVTKVNGVANTFASPSSSTTFLCFDTSKGYTRKYLLEEGTGTWCGWCPGGIVMMEYLKAKYPDIVYGIAVHGGDEMQVSSTQDVLGLFGGSYPSATINRYVLFNPVETELSALDAFIAEQDAVKSFAEVSEVSVEKINNNTISVKSQSRMAISMENENRYRLAYYITEDGVGPYEQQNKFAGGANGSMGGWENKGKIVPTIYDDVARLLSGGITGYSNSLPASIEAGKLYEHKATMSVAAVAKDDYFVTAFIVDSKTLEVIGAKQVAVSKTGGVSDVTEDALKITGAQGAVMISGEYTSASVWNMSVSLVATAAGESSIALPAGLYIVKAGDKVAKVMVK